MTEKFNDMYQHILDTLLSKYGHLSYSELTKMLRQDGLGEFVDAMENDPQLMRMISEISDEITENLPADFENGIIPVIEQQIQGIPVEYHGTFQFEPQVCLSRCRGNCCRNKNYLMIVITDLYRIVASKGAKYYDIHSTIDLFERTPPFIEIFYNEEYRFFLPYIRYLPVHPDINTRPENASESMCPFLLPVTEVYEFHNKDLPQWASEDALGCILMEDKPLVCRLSPLGLNRGMVTGRVTYEYLPPTRDCPACATKLNVTVSEYVASILSSAEQQLEEQNHEMLMAYHHSRTFHNDDQHHFHEIVKQMYHIDGLLSQHGAGIEHRPSVQQLLEIMLAAATGDFSVYENFLKNICDKVQA